jgi:predicted metallo-beta-lactamase superfamily hydrolase
MIKQIYIEKIITRKNFTNLFNHFYKQKVQKYLETGRQEQKQIKHCNNKLYFQK